jgi:hypothetical protein
VRRLALVLLASLLAFAPAQINPFFDDMNRQSHAYGLEMVALRLAVIEAFGTPLPDELEEQVEKIFGRDVPRFIGTLTALAPDVASALTAALEEVEEAAEEGVVDADAIAAARAAWGEAYALLVPDAVASQPWFVAAVIADLLLADDGVAEALEDGLEEEEFGEIPGGWAALQRVKALWESAIAPLMTEEQAGFAAQYLGFLDEIYPRAFIPASRSELPDNPEEAEAPAQSLVGMLEQITGADLYTGRDLPRLAGHLAGIVAPACLLFEAGDDAVALEAMYTTRNHYRKQLRRLLDLVAPEIHEVAGDILNAFVADDDEKPEDRVAACHALRDALEAAKTALGG